MLEAAHKKYVFLDPLPCAQKWWLYTYMYRPNSLAYAYSQNSQAPSLHCDGTFYVKT
jgi:hypothetical protein